VDLRLKRKSRSGFISCSALPNPGNVRRRLSAQRSQINNPSGLPLKFLMSSRVRDCEVQASCCLQSREVLSLLLLAPSTSTSELFPIKLKIMLSISLRPRGMPKKAFIQSNIMLLSSAYRFSPPLGFLKVRVRVETRKCSVVEIENGLAAAKEAKKG
jgi:hypothetical protein